MTTALVDLADQYRYQELFLKHLRWNAPDTPPQTVHLADGTTLTVANVSTYKGIRVWVCNQLPGAKAEVEVDKKLASTTTDRLVIFHDDEEQIWRWPVRRDRGHLTTTRLARHRHRAGLPDPSFAHRLAAIQLPTDTALEATAVLARVREAFDVERQNETRHASKLMAAMYTATEKAYPVGYDLRKRDHEISVTLARILFLMFGDDTGMWTPDAFRDHLLEHTKADGSDLQPTLQQLFDQLNDPTPTATSPIPYVNGGIFREHIKIPPVGADLRTAILTACQVDWSTISPAIFGSMFQSVRDAATRRALGEHYTSEENILKTLNPLFLDELRSDLDEAKTTKALNALWDRLGQIRFMDPACGCGNFIIVAYRELRDIELQIMERLKDIHYKNSEENQLEFEPTLALKVTLDHFYGIEIDEWPARIAETAMFLIDRQCDLKLKERFGEAPQRLPIQKQARIEIADALTIRWDSILEPGPSVVVAGNPPFLGHATRTESQAQQLRSAWGKDDISRLDYVTGWHATALRFFGSGPGLWAFVTTNSITQGDPVPHLFEPIFDRGWDIKFAHRTFPWASESSGKAAVHCVIIGFARAPKTQRLFDSSMPSGRQERRVTGINGYLVDGPKVFARKRTTPLSPDLPTATFGNMPRDDGNLIVEVAQHEEVAADPIAKKYLRPYMGSEEVLHSKPRWCLWLAGADPADLKLSRTLQERVDRVRQFRLDSSAASTRQMAQTPHLFGQRPALHTQPYLAIPRISSETRAFYPVLRVGPEVIPSDQTFTAADPDGILLGIISSSMFITWQRTIGGRLESRLRFSNTIVWNNLPLPPLKEKIRTDIGNAARVLQEARDDLGMSLAKMYAPGAMEPSLMAAHESLDAIVDLAFGAQEPCTTELDRQTVLFARFVEMT